MTKHWPQQSLLVQPEHHSHQLDFHIKEQQSFLLSNVACSSAAQRQPQFPALMSLKQLPRLEKPSERPEHICSATEFTERATSPGLSYPNAQNDHPEQDIINQDTLEKSKATGGKKKNYKRYPKPPYSYLAMIAMVIQRSTEKKLTLSEILKEISTLFPFFEGNYKGWRDSVRHNLSSYNCFVKVLKDPIKPQGKGNFWAVDLSRIPLELLKRQNTAVSRQDETIFAQDLAPYILQGQNPELEQPPDPVNSLPLVLPVNPSPPREDLFQPKLDSSFAIDSLLHSLRPTSASREAGVTTRDCYGEVERTRPSPGPQPCFASSARSASGSSASLPSLSPPSSDEEWKGVARSKKHSHPDGEASSGDCENYRQPQQKSARQESVALPWELPTSYAKYAPPNTIAPSSMRFSGGPLMSLHSEIPLYSYSSSPVVPGHFLGHTYWPILPSRRVSVQPPPLIMDLDNMLQSVPPNKSVFDALVPAGQTSHSHCQPQSPYALQNRVPPNRYHQY